MIDLDTKEIPENVLLVAVQTSNQQDSEALYNLQELSGLCTTLGLIINGEYIVKLKEAQSKYFIGKGWAEEIAHQSKLLEVDYIVFNEELSPRQQRNLEKLCDRPIIDYHQIILEIFAKRAQTKEARLQIELAQLIYSLPRLRRMWTHLSRQRGGNKGTRGEGETQLEADRRIIENRITKLRIELKHIRNQYGTLRKKREQIPVPTFAIVGYTNAGKSSLHHALTCSGTLVEDKLFATLDPTTRRQRLPSGQEVLLTDTVGFIRNLPHNLVEAFKSTLEETVFSQFLIHVVDCSSPNIFQHIHTTQSVLNEIGAIHKKELIVFNKCDLVSTDCLTFIRNRYPESCFISIKTKEGLDNLLLMLENTCRQLLHEVKVKMPSTSGNIISLAYREGQVISVEYQENSILLHAFLPKRIISAIKTMESLHISILH